MTFNMVHLLPMIILELLVVFSTPLFLNPIDINLILRLPCNDPPPGHFCVLPSVYHLERSCSNLKSFMTCWD
uniref:Putative ovule protein n=1 Tax=Solanum chacoense TaxID=4108 RepID=A0A0V0I637_SOLCH